MVKIKFLILLFLSIFILTGCHGCSFIQNQFGKKQTEQPPEQYQDQEQKKSEPIPTNPHHS